MDTGRRLSMAWLYFLAVLYVVVMWAACTPAYDSRSDLVAMGSDQ